MPLFKDQTIQKPYGSLLIVGLLFTSISVVAGVQPTHCQQDTSESILRDARRVSDPFEKQRLLRSSLRLDSLNVEAHVLLGATYYEDSGNISAAVEHFRTAQTLVDSTDASFSDASYYLDEIDTYFKPLRISISESRVSALGYIDGVDIIFRSPRSLEPSQQKRLAYLENVQRRRSNEFQLTGLYDNGVPYFEIPYFPVVFSLDDASKLKYALIVNSDQKRRYRFDFNSTTHDSVAIDWDSNWELVERVPTDLVKIDYPGTYRLEPLGASFHIPLEDSARGRRGLYFPADENIEVVLVGSNERKQERTLSRVIKGLVAAAALIGLGGSR